MIYYLLAIQSPSVAAVNASSIALQWNETIPVLAGNPHRNITSYEVTVTNQNDGTKQAVFVSAAPGMVYNITGLQRGSTYDIEINVVIDTEGQGEQTYDIGIRPITVNTTGK